MKTRFQQLFESSPDPMLIVDRAGQISQANAQAESLFGYRRGHLHGESAKTLFPGQSLTQHRGGTQPAGQSGHHLQLVGSRRDLTQFPADVVVIPLQTDQGTTTVLTIKDITEAQRAQFALDIGLDVLESADRDQHALLSHLIRAQEEERARIAADIHDDTIQTLSAASLRAQQLRHRLRNVEEILILGKLEEALSMSQSRLRQLIFDLRPLDLDHRSFVSSLKAYLEQMRSDTGIAYQLDDKCTDRSSRSRNVLIYRTTQEVLANVRKHARARMVRVQFLEVSDGCLARITDDGVGYDPAEIEQRPGHLGLTLIRERAQIAGGWARIESTPGRGTTVEFWIPFDEPPHRPEARRERAA
jgi:PAS domain S-box-containing protein